MIHRSHRALTNSELLLAATLALRFKLSPAEARAFMPLVKLDLATRPEIHSAIADGRPSTVAKLVDVILGKLRRKLAPHGIEIANVYGQGFRLTGATRQRVRTMIADYGEDVAAATPAGNAMPTAA